MNDKSAAIMVLERKNIAHKGREEYENRAIDNEKLYSNYIDESTHPYLSNIALPWPYIIVESYLGKCIQMMAAVLPYVRVVEEDDDSRTKAKRVEKDINMTMYHQKWPLLAYNVYKQAFKYGTAFLMEKPWGVVGDREMPIFSLMNFFHTWINPTCIDMEDEDNFLIYETYVPKWSLMKLKGNPEYKNLNKIRVHDGEIKSEGEKEIDAFKENPTLDIDPYSELVKVWTYWDMDKLIVLTNEDNVIRNGENFVGGAIPVKKITPIPVEGEPYGMSILEQGKDLFAEGNENRCQYNDAVNLLLNPQYIMDRNIGIKKTTIVAKSGNIIWTDDVSGIKPLPIDWNILTASMNRQGMIERDIMNYSNAFPQLRGQNQPGQSTATEYMGMRSAGELRSDTYNLLLSMMSIEAIAQDIVKFKRMFMTDPSSFYYWPEEKTNTVTPDDYSGNFTFKALAGYKMAREIERKQLIEAMTMIFGNQAFLPMVMPKANEWLSRLVDYFDLRSPEQLYVSDDEMKAQQMMQMVQGLLPILGGGGGQLALGEKAMRPMETTPNNPMGTMLRNEIMPTG